MSLSLEDQINLVRTPEGGGDFMSFVVRKRWFLMGVVRLLASIGRVRSKPINLGKIKLVLHHAQITEALRRDGDFLSSPGYKEVLARTNGPFVLGMDRSPQLSLEHGALYKALARYDLKALSARCSDMGSAILESQKGEFDAVQDYVWPICTFATQQMFGLAHIDPTLFQQASRAIFYHIFLELRPNKAVRKRAVAAGAMLKVWLSEEITRRRKAGPAHYGEDYMGLLMAEAGLDDDAVRRTLGGVLVGSIDTINGVTARIISLMSINKKLRQRVVENRHKPGYLAAYCQEAHRIWPQVPIMRRVAAQDTKLGERKLKKDNDVYLLTGAAMFDAKVFHRPMELRPDRPASAYLHFGAGVHACAGRAMAELQIPMLVGKLLDRNAQVTGKMRWAGPFPNHLPMICGGN
jgi:cytochrome P450